MTEVAEARLLAERHLASQLPRRWCHVQAAAAQAERVARQLGLVDGVLVAAVWLHDIGYGPELAKSGFHPLDGARFLRTIGVDVDDRVARLVAHHSCAVHEARVRGLERELLAEFDREDSPTYDALVYCDMITGPGGEAVGFLDRMDEIGRRYGPDHEVTRALNLGREDLTLCCRRTLERLQGTAAHPM
jgi:HD superfamily phosphodiesterase